MSEKFQIGWFIVEEDKEFTDRGFACAAWYETILVKAGKYPVMCSGFRYNERDRKFTDQIDDRSISIALNGMVVSDDFVARFCGSIVGNDFDKNVGKESSYYMNPYAHAVAIEILNQDGNIELIEGFEAREIPFEFNGENHVTYGIFKKG